MAWSKPFSKEEDQYIRKNYPAMGPSDIARHLGRSRQGVSNRVGALGLREKEPTMPARVVDACDARRKGPESLVDVARRGDELATLEALRDVLAHRIVETDSARDTASLAKRMLEVGERITEVKKDGSKQKKEGAGVSRFDVIAGRNAGRRAAAQG